MARYAQRSFQNLVAISLCYAAAAFGLGFLCLILFALIGKGVQGLSLSVFTEMTPPPGSQGGLLNAIVGSLIMTFLGVLIGTPIGMLAGTYMAEYGRGSKLTFVVRFINDILLSAPSIVVGLFVYEVLVTRKDFLLNAPQALLNFYPYQMLLSLTGHFTGFAGAIALAIIVIPVVVRTTEDMLLLVPPQMREAATALGLPRVHVITKIAYKAASAGLMTGVLLAIARASGETAPLLFTALNSPFFSTDLSQPMASLPAVIFQFAMSPYADWQQLAWAGALIITLAVLALSILARILASRRATA